MVRKKTTTRKVLAAPTKKKVTRKKAPVKKKIVAKKKGAWGGARAGAGRRGITEIAKDNIDRLNKLGFDPLEFLALVGMGNYRKLKCKKEDLTMPVRTNAAKDLLPYIAPKLRSLELTDPQGNNPLSALVNKLKQSTDEANKNK